MYTLHYSTFKICVPYSQMCNISKLWPTVGGPRACVQTVIETRPVCTNRGQLVTCQVCDPPCVCASMREKDNGHALYMKLYKFRKLRSVSPTSYHTYQRQTDRSSHGTSVYICSVHLCSSVIKPNKFYIQHRAWVS